MSVINTNVKSMLAQNALTTNNRSMTNAMEQLSTGFRINSAKDDAAGLAISQNMTAQIRGLDQAVRNANDSIGLLQTAGSNILNGDSPLATGTNKAFEFQVGANANQKLTISVGDMRISGATDSLLNDVAGKTISSSAGAQTTIGDIDKALNAINSQRATIGAVVNRLTFAVDNLTNVSMNAEASRSQVQDTDYASATTELSRTQIIQQAATAMLAQANQQPATVLSLLR